MSAQRCPICENSATTVADRIIGYRDDLYFSIMECGSCEVSYSLPTVSDNTLYEWIYSSLEMVPGYSRYHSYFEGVRNQVDPLGYLISKESAYWACAEYLRAAESRLGRRPRILELGCGAGYLTYALRESGHDITGADISTSAIAKARSAFGGSYRQMDVFEESLPSRERYDIIMMVELIEHVPDPVSFLSAARRLLVQHGEMFVTTPNKEAARERHVWDTDLPPVHLFWFTPSSFEAIAQLVGCEVSFTDFTEYFKGHYVLRSNASGCNHLPTFSHDGRLLRRASLGLPKRAWIPKWSRYLAEVSGALGGFRKFRDSIKGNLRWTGPTGQILAACFKF